MVITITLIVCSVLALIGGLARRLSVTNHEPVRSTSLGPFSVELRRRGLVRGHPNGKGGQAFAQPSETRVRVFCIVGLPVWRQAQRVELPLQVVNMIGTLTARDFDMEFEPRFRVASFAALAPAWAARQPPDKKSGSGRTASERAH